MNFAKNILRILKSGFKQFFLKTSDGKLLLEERWQDDLLCAAVIDSTVKGCGRKWLIPVDLALFLSGLFLLIGDDYIEAHTLSFIVHMLAVTVVCAFLIFQSADMSTGTDVHCRSLCVFTYLPLIIIVALGYCGGI